MFLVPEKVFVHHIVIICILPFEKFIIIECAGDDIMRKTTRFIKLYKQTFFNNFNFENRMPNLSIYIVKNLIIFLPTLYVSTSLDCIHKRPNQVINLASKRKNVANKRTGSIPFGSLFIPFMKLILLHYRLPVHGHWLAFCYPLRAYRLAHSGESDIDTVAMYDYIQGMISCTIRLADTAIILT